MPPSMAEQPDTTSSEPGAWGLTRSGCRQRQERVRALIRDRGLDGALLFDPRHVHYLTGHWGPAVYSVALFIPAEGPVVLATGYKPDPRAAADRMVEFVAARHATLVDDQPAAVVEALGPFLQACRSLGTDTLPPGLLAGRRLDDLRPGLLAMRRTKDLDEIVMLRRAIAGCEAAYAVARKLLKPGISEVELYAAMQAAAVAEVGEPIGEFGNDFRSGAPGGPPRNRAVRAGELIPLDLSVVVRGYCSDLCRTLAVGGRPSSAQREAHRLVVQALRDVEAMVRSGVSCRAVFEATFARIDGRNGWRFPHHLGHGIGLSPHEAPRLNPNWDDTFMVGDVFTVEPGLYHEDLAAGVRIEEEYLVTEDGVLKLSQCSTAL